MVRFNKLDVPYQWRDEFTKYPHGYTIFEALCKWAGQVDDMVDEFNKLVDGAIDEPVRKAIDNMAASGELGNLIQELIIIDGGVF